jgi:hypothetical protein
MAERFAQHVGAVSPLDEALDGTPVKRKRSAKKANPNSEVTTNVVCYCGARFDDLVDFSAHVRADCPELVRLSELRKANGHRLVAECGTTAGSKRHRIRGEPNCDLCRAANREYDAARRAARPEYRGRKNEQERKSQRWRTPEYREKKREYDRARRAAPEYRGWQPTPEQRERHRDRERERYRRKKAEKEAAIQEAGNGGT